MQQNHPVLNKLIQELKNLNVQDCSVEVNLSNVSTVLKKYITNVDWLDEEYLQVTSNLGFESWLIHEELNHTLAINLVAWKPSIEIVPHDHRTWGVVGSLVGIEKNTFWERLDDGKTPGYADIVRGKETICSAGEIVTFMPEDIHSVVNIASEVGVSLHVYGKNLNYTGRCQYNPFTKSTKPFLVDFT